MEQIYRQTYKITDLHVDCFGRARPSAIAFLAQSAAGGHCNLLKLDWETLAKRNLFWAIIRQRVQVNRLPVRGETVTVETWPLPTTRAAFPRATVCYDQQGNELFRAIALWILMDLNTRAMVVPGKSGIDFPGCVVGGELPSPKSLTPKDLPDSTQRKVRFGQLDRNGHMNNTKYLEWVMDLLPGSFHGEHPLKSFAVCYLNESKEGDCVKLRHSLADNTLLVDATRPDPSEEGKSHRVFAVRAEFC